MPLPFPFPFPFPQPGSPGFFTFDVQTDQQSGAVPDTLHFHLQENPSQGITLQSALTTFVHAQGISLLYDPQADPTRSVSRMAPGFVSLHEPAGQ
jgi:hypothetical protein